MAWIRKQCSVCGKKFKSHQGLGGHMSGPCGSRKAKTLEKGAKRVVTQKLEATSLGWVISHLDGTYSCTVCDKKFKSVQAINGHRRSCKGSLYTDTATTLAGPAQAQTVQTQAGLVQMQFTAAGQSGFGAHAEVKGLPRPADVAVTSFPPGVLKPVGEAVLQEAQRLVYGDRNKDYGHPLDDFSRTGEMATGLLRGKLRPGAQITAEDVGMFMILIKLSRQVNRPKRDNMVDTAGYAGTIQMCVDERSRRNGF